MEEALLQRTVPKDCWPSVEGECALGSDLYVWDTQECPSLKQSLRLQSILRHFRIYTCLQHLMSLIIRWKLSTIESAYAVRKLSIEVVWLFVHWKIFCEDRGQAFDNTTELIESVNALRKKLRESQADRNCVHCTPHPFLYVCCYKIAQCICYKMRWTRLAADIRLTCKAAELPSLFSLQQKLRFSGQKLLQLLLHAKESKEMQ